MNLHNGGADLFVPDGLAIEPALARTTHLGVGAHQDDLEIMAFHGILACHDRDDRWFTGITCTNGGGSARSGAYAGYTDADMQQVRREEQRTAARIGRYAAMGQLDYPSAAVKDPADRRLAEDLAALFALARPQVVYTHNPADKHATHVAVTVAVLRALRALPPADRPAAVYGSEVWRNLDWMPDAEKVVLPTGGRDNLAAALMGVYDSQIAGGKRYDLATAGRWRANATFFESHAVDDTDQAAFAMDLTPLVRDETLDPADYVAAVVDRFRASVVEALRRYPDGGKAPNR